MDESRHSSHNLKMRAGHPDHPLEGQADTTLDVEMVSIKLQGLGLSPQEARVYLGLLSGSRTPREVAEETGNTQPSVTRILGDLAGRGLVNRLPGRVTRFAMSPPEWVLPSLIRQREEEIEELRRITSELGRRHRVGEEGEKPEEYVEVIAGWDAVVAHLDHQLQHAKNEVCSFTKLPMLKVPRSEDDSPMARGVASRVLWERQVLEVPGMMDTARALTAAGQENRTVAQLPSKLLILDGKTALIHVTETSGGGAAVAALLTRHPELVGTLYRLFNMLWDVALPIFEHDSGKSQLKTHKKERDRLVACLAAGMNDVAIQHSLGLSRRTLSRRIQDLMNELGVDSRFQAGFKLGRARE